jgi:hypothetical protein
MSESCNELIVDPELLVSIQRQCQERAAELEAAAVPPRLPGAPEHPQSVLAMAEVPPPISEAELFAAAIEEMPGDVRRFFEREEPVPPHRWESDEERAQRERLTDLGGWCG